MAVLCRKCWKPSGPLHQCKAPPTVEEVQEEMRRMIKRVDDAHKAAGNSKLVFGAKGA